jgi:hypothetical protein
VLGYLVVLSLLASAPVLLRPLTGECVELTGQMILAEALVDLVFSGKVVDRVYVGKPERPTYRATFEVDRVWKGTVSKRMDIYVSEMSPEIPRFDKGRDYVVIATRVVDVKWRDDIGPVHPKAQAFAALQCSDALPPNIREQLGQGTRPK